jgi:hypothetical protein
MEATGVLEALKVKPKPLENRPPTQISFSRQLCVSRRTFINLLSLDDPYVSFVGIESVLLNVVDSK